MADQMTDQEATQIGFTIEFYNEVKSLGEVVEARLQTEADRRLRKLMRGHTDLTGASIAIEQPAERATSYLYRARVVVYARPENIAGVAEEETAEIALKQALSAVERQVRERRKKLGEPYKQP